MDFAGGHGGGDGLCTACGGHRYGDTRLTKEDDAKAQCGLEVASSLEIDRVLEIEDGMDRKVAGDDKFNARNRVDAHQIDVREVGRRVGTAS